MIAITSKKGVVEGGWIQKLAALLLIWIPKVKEKKPVAGARSRELRTTLLGLDGAADLGDR